MSYDRILSTEPNIVTDFPKFGIRPPTPTDTPDRIRPQPVGVAPPPVQATSVLQWDPAMKHVVLYVLAYSQPNLIRMRMVTPVSLPLKDRAVSSPVFVVVGPSIYTEHPTIHFVLPVNWVQEVETNLLLLPQPLNISTSPALDQSKPGPSKSSPMQSEKFLDWDWTNPHYFWTWTELAWTDLD